MMNCSTEPEIDHSKIDNIYFTTGVLRTSPGHVHDEDTVYYDYSQQIIVQRIRFIVDYAFNPDGDMTYGVPGASVTVSSRDSSYTFTDQGNGIYIWDERYIFPQPGRRYRLEVEMADGTRAFSEITTPKIYFPEVSDTVWFWPDSIENREPYGNLPFDVSGPHYQDTINYSISDGAVLSSPSLNITQPFQNSIWDQDAGFLYYKLDPRTDHLLISTAVDSPSSFIKKYQPQSIQIRYTIQEESKENYEQYFEYDDFWPIDNIGEISNIEGSYGIFTSASFGITREYILALKR